jgi:hypothetical protein
MRSDSDGPLDVTLDLAIYGTGQMTVVDRTVLGVGPKIASIDHQRP